MPLRAHVQFTPFDASSGAALTSATVNVFQPGTVTPVAGTLFDKNGNTLANPLTSDATTGLVDFYMNVAQEVDLQVAKSGFTTRTYSNVPVLGDAGNDLTALMTTTGDIVIATSANTPARLAIGSAQGMLAVSGGVPAWVTALSTLSTSNLTLQVPCVRAFNNASIGLTSGASTAIAFNSERYKTDTNMHSNVTNNTRLTATVAGKYRMSAHIEFAANATGNVRQVTLRVNGATTIAAATGPLNGTNATEISVSTTYSLALNDYVEVIGLQDSGGSLNVNSAANYSPEFTMELVSA